MNLLDNITWHSLSGPHARFSLGTETARRFAPGFSPILGFADRDNPDLGALRPFCAPEETFYCAGWRGDPPVDWKIEVESTMFQMVWDVPAPNGDDAPDAIPLGPEHTPRAVELAEMTRPGPFGPRTLELGDYFGYFDGNNLVAMAGERLHAGPFREISGVCTHPAYQGRGFARRLMFKLIRRQVQRGETPFLHVIHDNDVAWRLYERMGFRRTAEVAVRVVHRRQSL